MKLRIAPFWYDRFPQRRRPAYPRLRASVDTRVVIIGGGLTGCACACSLAAARIPVVLLEADRIGGAATAGSLGLLREDFEVSFTATAAAYGVRAARTLWQAMRRASLDFPSAVRRFGIRSEVTPQDLVNVARWDAGDTRALRRDYEARRAAGLDHRWITPLNLRRESAVESTGAIRTRGAVFDPYRTCLGLAAAAADRDAVVYERTQALRIRARAKSVEVTTAGGVVQAETVVVAGAAAIPDLSPLRRHLRPRHGYGVTTEPLAAPVRREVGARNVVLRERGTAPRFVRWLKEDRVMIEGDAQEAVPGRARDQAIVQRTGQLMYELSLLYPAISGTRPEWGWSFAFDDTVDGLPYIGPHRNFPRHLFALGLGRHGAGAAWLAARLLLRQIVAEPAKGDELLGFGRILQGHH